MGQRRGEDEKIRVGSMWANAEAYDKLMGRWSERLAPLLIDFAGVRDGDRLLDVGCGTGSLSRTLARLMPRSEVVGTDPASPYIAYARRRLASLKVRYEVGDAQDLTYPDASFDKCLSLLVLNFIPNARRAVQEMRRVSRPGGWVAAAVWDYGQGMTMLRSLWDAAVALDPETESRDERHMPFCRQGELAALWNESGLQEVEETALVIRQDFEAFEDYWAPFLATVGPSGSYVTSLPPERQEMLRERLRGMLLGGTPDQPFTLEARAWAVRGMTPTK